MNVLAEIVVVGGGIEGLSVAWHLARRGVTNILVLERATLCSGGTGKSSGIVRCHYGVPSLASMAWYGLQFFEKSSSHLGYSIGFEQVGYVVGVGPADAEAMRVNVEMQRSLGVETRLMPLDEVEKMWPEANLADFGGFAYEKRGGYCDPYLTGQAFGHACRELGVHVRQQAAVTDIRVAADKVVGVVVDGSELVSTETVILAAGPWSVALAESAGVMLPIGTQRQQIVLTSVRNSMYGAPVLSDLVGLQYFLPERSGGILIGNSDHKTPEPIDPDDYPNEADDEFIHRAISKAWHRLPGLSDPRVTGSYVGCYDVTPDYNPIISTCPVAGLIVCAGFSGHGFKISPAVGRLVADLVTSGESSEPSIPHRDFRLSRFEERQALVSRHRYIHAGQMR